MEELFTSERRPLAARMRPRTLSEFVGQEQILGAGRLLRRAIESDQLSSIILSGPPGTGKTTLARVIANTTRSQFLSVSAVLSGVKELRAAIEEAKAYRNQYNRRSILFVDEVHRWNKSQQDALLPWVEDGLIVLIGATTENPWFEVNRALLSRSRVFILRPLTETELATILDRALSDRERGYGARTITIDEDARRHLITTSAGDARTVLNALELAVDGGDHGDVDSIHIDLQTAEDSIQRGAILYDKDGDYHFDTISAFIKSLRGSDPDAALYWLARMISAGEDPRYVFRRMLISASEDIGLADPAAITVVTSCAAAFDRVGMPEGQFHLTQAALYLAGAEKSNSTLGYFDALAAIESEKRPDVPTHLRDANRDGDDLGHGQGYLYPHAYKDHWVAQAYLPTELRDRVFYRPGDLGWEGARKAVTAERRRTSLLLEDEDPVEIWATRGSRSTGARWIHTLRSQVGPAVEELGSTILDAISPSPTDRVLLAGDMVAPLVPVVARSVPEGLTAVWTTPEAAERLRLGFSLFPGVHDNATDSSVAAIPVDRPQIATLSLGSTPDPPFHPGPFEVILYRDTNPADPETLLSNLLPLLETQGTLLLVETEPLEGTRPSALLPEEDPLRSRLETIERDLYPPRTALREEAIERAGLRDRAEVRRVETTTTRTIDERLLGRWFGAEGVYARGSEGESQQAAPVLAEALERLKATVPREVSWIRVSTLVRVRLA